MIKGLFSYKKYIYLALVTVANFWFWQILENNLFFGLLVLIIEVALFELIAGTNRKNRMMFVTLAIGATICTLVMLRDQFDKTLLVTSPTEVSIQAKRHNYLADGLGIFFTNKYSLHYYKDYSLGVGKYLRNVFYTLDPNLYFFRSHPREKLGIDESYKYPPIVLPFFVVGILFLFVNYSKYKPLTIYLTAAALFTGFLDPAYKLGPILIFPFTTIAIYFGFATIVTRLKLKFAK